MANYTLSNSSSLNNFRDFSICYEELQARLSEIQTLLQVWVDSDLEYMPANKKCWYICSIDVIVSLAIQNCEELKNLR